MNRRFSILVGVMLILMGGLMLVSSFVAGLLGLDVWDWGAWRLWPLAVVCAGLFFVASPLLVRGHRGLGGLFIPGVPILAAGGVLLAASAFDVWYAWEWAWGLVVLAVALGFLFAAIYMRVIWLLIPAIIIGANGAVLQFCAITDLWEMWAVLWAIEPLAVGTSLLLISASKRSSGLFLAGIILCGLAGMGLVGMTAILPEWWVVNLVGPAVVVLVGLLLLIWSVTRRPASSEPSVG